jgi:tripartite-type tricarboxylate transporter receptor subunit TctC
MTRSLSLYAPRLRGAVLTIAAGVVAALLNPLAPTAQAQGDNFPERPIQLVVGYGAGGSTDSCFRALAHHAGSVLGQPMVVVNKPGAGSSLSINWLTTQPADGYTIAALATGAVLNQFLNPKSGYDVVNDLEPIALVALYQAGLLVKADSPWRSVADVVEAARSGKEKVSYATAGVGTPQHLTMSRLGQLTGAEWDHVPHKSGTEAVTSVIRGDVSVLSQTAEWAPFVRDGRLRLLAVYTDSRMDGFADSPTLREAGYDLVAPSMLGVVGPKGVPPARIARLEAALREAAAAPAFINCSDQFALKRDFRASADFGRYIAETVRDWSPVAKAFANK